MKRRYKFLIFVGEGEHVNGLPSTLTTRLANSLHRKIYFKIRYYKDGIGVIEDCHYFDRQYKEDCFVNTMGMKQTKNII